MRRRNTFKRIFFTVLGLVFTVTLVISANMVFSIVSEQRESARLYEDLGRLVYFPQERLPTQTQYVPVPGNSPGEEEYIAMPAFPVVDFAALQEINPNVVGWLVLEGTVINYPVVHWSDNDRYLHRLFDGTRNAAGTLFVDSRNQRGFEDLHNIIHGHHMNDGTMFAVLLEYRSQEFFEAHPQMLLMTPEGNYIIQIFAGYVADVRENSWQIHFNSYTEFDEWIRQSIARSDFTSNLRVGASDQIITFSTCFHDARYVVLGKLIPVG